MLPQPTRDLPSGALHATIAQAISQRPLSQLLDVEVVSLRLVDPRFYHLDTCFCPLPGGRVLWYPPAFDAPSRALVEQRVSDDRRLAVHAEDALSFACNAVVASESDIVLHCCSEALMNRLRAWGLRPHIRPLSEFLKAGGAAKCLTLCLN
jgi:N-dimethylarginine dimethylaminohydrolase